MKITIYTITYNEELILPYFIRHYRANFPNCRIIVFDNQSTDKTVEIAKAHGCEVITYETGGELSDMKYLEIKNNCWKLPRVVKPAEKDTSPYLNEFVAGISTSAPPAVGEWVFIVDADELCQITELELLKEHDAGTTMLQFEGYNMVNLTDNTNVAGITHAVPAPDYSKRYAFCANKITEINYTPGCHVCAPVGEVKLSQKVYKCYHYRYIHAELLVTRYARNLQRMSRENKRKGMGSHYAADAARIRADFADARQNAQQIRTPMPQPRMRLFIAGFDDNHFGRVPATPDFVPVNMAALGLGELQNNLLSEHRLLLSDVIDKQLQIVKEPEHNLAVGILTWRWHQKCKHLLPFHKIPNLPFSQTTVWAAWPAPNWYRHSIVAHKGIQPYLDELCDFTGLSAEGTGLYGNQFICSATVFADFQQFFLKCFAHFHGRYGLNGFNFWVKEADQNRLPAVFYERIACLYFANRKDLEIKQIPNRH